MTSETQQIDLRAVYDRFFALGAPPVQDKDRKWRYRRQVTSIGWPAVRLIGEIVRERRPARVLDLGSGLTTIVLRELAREIPGMQVVTTDTSRGWLLKTMLECRRDGLSDRDFFMHGTFEADPLAREQYDLITVDIADTPFRRALAPKLAKWLAPGGTMVLDDWQIQPYAPTMRVRLEEEGLTVEPKPATADEFGRFVALAYRVEPSAWEWSDDE